ncbi:DegQ family serine endoprotease [Candidatus Deferrimicrobium sp.]|uniref:DegQ family serine endoprotease n=1 Tax=Candidatus Deferrimicrobium sp. TaxID=3060586 RepID=UPI002ED42241
MIRKSRVVILVLAAVAAGIVLTAGFNFSPIARALWGEKEKPAVVPAAAGMRMLPVDIPQLFKDVSPAVVNISTTQTVKFNHPQMRNPFGQQDPFDEFFNNFFGRMPREQKQKRRSLGSGFIVSPDGYILTNNHVVEKADEVTVTLLDKEEFKAKVVGSDSKIDIALIKIDTKKKLPYVSLGDSDRLEVGEWVLAIGNPFGLGHTVTAGIVSAKGRIIGSGPYDDFIQTDASINPGNSGGPLFNLKGEVVGINTAIISGGQGIGFATPIQLAKSVLEQLKDKGKVTRGWLGVYVQELTSDAAENLGISGRHGALVSDVTSGGPAEKAGIRSGDVIIGFNGKEIKDWHELPQAVASVKPGKTANDELIRDVSGRQPGTLARLDIVREGRRTPVTVTLAERPPRDKTSDEVTPGLAPRSPLSPTGNEPPLGLTVHEVDAGFVRRLEIPADVRGVMVTGVEPAGAAFVPGMRRGFIVMEINRRPVRTVAEFQRIVSAARPCSSA